MIRKHYKAPLAELNRMIDSAIALLQTRDIAILNILQNPEGNRLEKVGETLGNVYDPPQADDDCLGQILYFLFYPSSETTGIMPHHFPTRVHRRGPPYGFNMTTRS